MTILDGTKDYLVAPDPSRPDLTRAVRGIDQTGAETEISVVEERPLTIYLNSQEIVTAMTRSWIAATTGTGPGDPTLLDSPPYPELRAR